MKTFIFRAKTFDDDIFTSTSVINKYDRLLLSNEARPGHWVECVPDTLEVIEIDTSFKKWLDKGSKLGQGVDLNTLQTIFNAIDEEDK